MDFSPGEIVLIITTSVTGVVTIINAAGGAYANMQNNVMRKALDIKADVGIKKLDEIHQLTNSDLTSVQGRLTIALERIDRLELLLDRKVLEKKDEKVVNP